MANQKTFTRTYWNLFSALFGGANNGSASTETPSYNNQIYCQNTDGVYKTILPYHFYYMYAIADNLAMYDLSRYYVDNFNNNSYSSHDNLHPFIQLGKGTGELSEENYNLFEPLFTNFTIGTMKLTSTYDAVTHQYTRTWVVPFAYSGNEPVTISEFGVYGKIPTGVYNTDRPYYSNCLLYHELLETPVTLQTNDTIEITFSQSIVQPHYTEYPIVE